MCVCAHMQMHPCLERQIWVCRCMCVEEAGVGERRREWDSEKEIINYLHIYFLTYSIFSVAS